MNKCPRCGEKEVKLREARTMYNCGSVEYGQKPNIFFQSDLCREKEVDGELQETIENGLHSTGKFELEHCSDLARQIILLMKQEEFKITKP